jgi:hypothetical protein
MPQGKQDRTTAVRPVEKFRAGVLAAYEPIMREFGFVELPLRKGKYVNKFAVRIGNTAAVIEVEGTGYGSGAWTKVFRAGDADTSYYGLPIGALLLQRQGLSPTDLKKRRGKPIGQLGEIQAAAAMLLEHAKDVLSGDFSKLDEIAEQQRLLKQEWLSNALSGEEKAAVVAASEAGHAFKRGDYGKVVALLEPHLDRLSESQRRRLEIAKTAMAERRK